MNDSRPAHSPVTREKLMDAAGEIFAEKGLRGATIRDITQRAGANIAAVNYHFRDKFELYTLVLRRAHDGIVSAMNQPLTADTPAGRIRQLLSALLTSALDPNRPDWHRQLLSRELLQPTAALDLMLEHVERPSHRILKAVGEIRPDLSEQQLMLTASCIIAQCVFFVHHGHLMRKMFPNVPQPALPVLVEHVVEYSLAALSGLQALPAPASRPPAAGSRSAGAKTVRRTNRKAARSGR